MYKNQLQELAQRSCFILPSYTCLREGPDHAPRFKAVVNFNGQTFESPNYCSTLRHAEHSAAEAALLSLSSRGGAAASHSLAARMLDETGVYKNLLQEIAQRVGSPLPYYTTFRSGLGHLPVFTGTVELAGITFTGEPAKNKKQAEKNAALAAWLSLKQLARQEVTTSSEHESNSEEQQQITIAKALQNYCSKATTTIPNGPPTPFHNKSPLPSPQRPTLPTSKILPLFSHKAAASRNRLPSSSAVTQSRRDIQSTMKFPAVGPGPYAAPFRQCGMPHRGMVQPVTMRNVVPVFCAPPPSPTLPADDEGILANGTSDVDESTAARCVERLEI